MAATLERGQYSGEKVLYGQLVITLPGLSIIWGALVEPFRTLDGATPSGLHYQGQEAWLLLRVICELNNLHHTLHPVMNWSAENFNLNAFL